MKDFEADFLRNYDSNLEEAVFSQTEASADYPSHRIYEKHLKRLFDIVLASLLLPILLPVIGLIWILVKRDGGPGLFSQKRIGLNGKTFLFWKVRTMVPNAESVLENLCESDPSIAKEWQKNQKLRNDPRVTKLGAFLRSTSLDELPQIWNVLIGDMSLVGPRPFMQSQEKGYRAAGGKAYFKMRPGVTGLWQVEGRGITSFSGRVPYDNSYLTGLTFRKDLYLILMTFSVVVRRTGH